jgi:hypothetical protein
VADARAFEVRGDRRAGGLSFTHAQLPNARSGGAVKLRRWTSAGGAGPSWPGAVFEAPAFVAGLDDLAVVGEGVEQCAVTCQLHRPKCAVSAGHTRGVRPSFGADKGNRRCLVQRPFIQQGARKHRNAAMCHPRRANERISKCRSPDLISFDGLCRPFDEAVVKGFRQINVHSLHLRAEPNQYVERVRHAALGDYAIDGVDRF